MNILKIIGRMQPLFQKDLLKFEEDINHVVRNNRFLVIGGAGSIGQAVTKQLFARSAGLLHVVDLSENYLVELVRDIRSELGYITEKFDTFAIDCGAPYFKDFLAAGKYDYVLNLSAMKHVRSENSAFSMLRMLETNVLNPISNYEAAVDLGVKKYFCVSTDKAANPANFMGATKRAMEIALMRIDSEVAVSGARFANVAFSNGSLLQGFENRLAKQQPLSTPSDIERFFVTPVESGLICLFSAILGERNEILFPYNDREIKLHTFLEIAKSYLKFRGLTGVECNSEQEARDFIKNENLLKYWPINVFESDTVGEKPFEEFFTDDETLIYHKYLDLASVKYNSKVSDEDILFLKEKINRINPAQPYARENLLEIVHEFVPTFSYVKADKFLNARM